MRKLILALLVLLSCSSIDSSPILFEEVVDVPPTTQNPALPSLGYDYPTPTDYSIPICRRQLIVFRFNCWIIMCTPPCRKGDYDCFDSYCEIGIDTPDPGPRE